MSKIIIATSAGIDSIEIADAISTIDGPPILGRTLDDLDSKLESNQALSVAKPYSKAEIETIKQWLNNVASGDELLAGNCAASLLDGLKQADPENRSLLVFCGADFAVTKHLSTGGNFDDLTPLLKKWLTSTRQLIDYYVENTADSLLIDIDTICAESKQFADILGSNIGCVAEFDKLLMTSEVCAEARLIAHAAIMERDELFAVLDDARVAATLVSGKYEFVDQYQQLLDAVQAGWCTYVQSRKDNEFLAGENLELKDRIDLEETQRTKYGQENEQLTGQHLQLAQEIEAQRLRNQELEENIQELQSADTVAEQKQALVDAESARTARIGGLEAELAKRQSELEKAQTTFRQQVKDLESRLGERESALHDVASKLATAEAQNVEREEKAAELELALLQLQQIQEELEHYFIKYQESKRSADELHQLSPLLEDLPSLRLLRRLRN